MPSAKNIARVHQLEQELTKAKSLVLADYRGLSVADIQKLRSQIRQAGGFLTVAKNTLLKIALQKTNRLPRDLEEILRGPTVLLLALDDPIAPIKALVEFAQTHALNLPTPKAGLLKDRLLTPDDINLLASLPPRPQLMAQFAHQLQAPILSLANVLQANLRQLVYALTAVQHKKSTAN